MVILYNQNVYVVCYLYLNKNKDIFTYSSLVQVLVVLIQGRRPGTTAQFLSSQAQQKRWTNVSQDALRSEYRG